MMKHKLPKNWVVLNSKSYPDRVYYFNTKTKQTSWEEPTADGTEQKSGESSRRYRKSIQVDKNNEVQPTTPEYNVSEKEVGARKRFVGRKSLRQTKEKVNEEKVTEEKETPQMKAIREKMLKKKEKNIPKTESPKLVKDVNKLQHTKYDKTNSLPQKSDVTTSSKTVCTPQMQILLEKIEARTSRYSKVKREEESKDEKQEEEINSRLRKKGANNRKSISDSLSSVESRNKRREQNQRSPKVAATEKNVTGKRKIEESDSPQNVSLKRKSLKKNIGRKRMEKLRKSLTLISDNDESLNDNTSTSNFTSIEKPGKLPCIYKNAEVRLIRLKERLSKEKISSNKNSCTNKSEETLKSSEKSVTTIDDLVKQSNEDSFYEEMDWEPLEDEKITFEVQTVRTQLCTENNTSMPRHVPDITLKYPLLSEQHEKKQLYIVIDTNVFLSNIEAIELARKSNFKTYDQPVIVIPWTVIRELDYIKGDNGKTKSATLCVKARKAVNYINKLFSSKQPRIIGQTPEDVAKNKEKFAIDCPDDEILQTCLQIRDFEKSVVLLSYDVNLCNKAMIYDIATLGRNDPLEKIDYLNASNYVNETLSTSSSENRERPSFGSVSTLSQELSLSDEILEDAKSIIRDFLTVIVGKEMHALYGESWEKYVIISPPWTTVTVLQCAIKHWIAAVSDSFQRKAEIMLKQLLEIFKNTSDKRSLKEDSYILDKCSDLVQMVNMDKHRDLMLRVSKKIDELKEKCHDYELQINEQKLCDAIGVENNIDEQERRAQKAFQYFEAAYVYARDMCGLAAEAVGMPTSFHYTLPNPLPTLDYVKQIQPELAANVNRLLCSLSAVIEQVKSFSIEYRTLANLHQTLITFLPESTPMMAKLINIDLVPLDVYCCIKRKEEVLNRGLRQLQELSTHFCRLASYRCV
ncbi:Transcriptional protein SWT1 [Anthophora retusa]